MTQDDATGHGCKRWSRFKPCIDLHDGKVKQIVGGTLSDDPGALRTNFVASQTAGEFARLYKEYGLHGGHVIMLGPRNEDAAREALKAWPGGLQIGGGITAANAQEWIDAGASKVIVTSYLFSGAKFSRERLEAMSEAVGKDRIVVDVSCRRRGEKWFVAMNKWQVITDMEVCKGGSENGVSATASEGEVVGHKRLNLIHEFLIHAADVEGLCQGIDQELVTKLGEWVTIPTTYAGGAKHVDDLALVDSLSNGKVDLTYGSSLDIFGGTLVKVDELVDTMRRLACDRVNCGL